MRVSFDVDNLSVSSRLSFVNMHDRVSFVVDDLSLSSFIRQHVDGTYLKWKSLSSAWAFKGSSDEFLSCVTYTICFQLNTEFSSLRNLSEFVGLQV